MRDDEDRTTGGRLFQARGAATGNDRSAKVDLLTGGTMRDAVADERRWTSLNVSYVTDALGEVGRSCAVQTAVRQNTETKPYTLRSRLKWLLYQYSRRREQWPRYTQSLAQQSQYGGPLDQLAARICI